MKILFSIIIFLSITYSAYGQFSYLYSSIPANDSISGTFDKNTFDLLSVDIPNGFQGTHISFLHSSWLDSTFIPLVYDSLLINVPVVTNSTIAVKPWEIKSLRRYFRIKSDSTESTAKQLKCDKGIF